MNEDVMAYFVGIICGDGYVSRNNSLIEVKDEYFDFLLDVYIPVVKKLFNITPNLIPESNNLNAYRCFFNSTYASGLLKKWSIVSPKTFTVCMPEWIKTNYLNVKINFVRGAMDADGDLSIKKNKDILNYPTIKFSSRSKKFAEDIQSTLLELGINAKLTSSINNNKPLYQVRIYGFRQFKKFMEKIGFKHPYKLRKAIKLLKCGIVRADRSTVDRLHRIV